MREGVDYSEHGAKVVAQETPDEPVWVGHDGGGCNLPHDTTFKM